MQMSKKNQKAVENVVENEINDVENQNQTTDADEIENVENQEKTDETMPENETENDEIENETNDDQKDEVENVEWLIHVKAIWNWWSVDKGCEYWIDKKFFEEKKYLFEVLD